MVKITTAQEAWVLLAPHYQLIEESARAHVPIYQALLHVYANGPVSQNQLQTLATASYDVATTRESEDTIDHLDTLSEKVLILLGSEFPTVE